MKRRKSVSLLLAGATTVAMLTGSLDYLAYLQTL